MNRSTATIHLIDLPTPEACRLKWEAGRAKYGREFAGHPILELDYELLDGMNYCDEGRRQGYRGLGIAYLVLRGVRCWVRWIWRRRRVGLGTDYPPASHPVPHPPPLRLFPVRPQDVGIIGESDANTASALFMTPSAQEATERWNQMEAAGLLPTQLLVDRGKDPVQGKALEEGMPFSWGDKAHSPILPLPDGDDRPGEVGTSRA